jgi:hypothetical protein
MRQTVREGLHNRTWVRCINGGLSVTEVIEYLHLWTTLNSYELTDAPDRLVWRWTEDGRYTAKSAYSMMHVGSIKMCGHKLVWKTWAPLRIKIFLWLALRRRHWTGDRRRRHGLDAQASCYLCDQAEESIDHIIIECPLARELWFHILHSLGQQLPQAQPTTLKWWRQLRSTFSGIRKPGADSLFALVSWTIWKERNARCFRQSSATIAELLQLIKDEADRWIQAGAPGLKVLAQG